MYLVRFVIVVLSVVIIWFMAVVIYNLYDFPNSRGRKSFTPVGCIGNICESMNTFSDCKFVTCHGTRSNIRGAMNGCRRLCFQVSEISCPYSNFLVHFRLLPSYIDALLWKQTRASLFKGKQNLPSKSSFLYGTFCRSTSPVLRATLQYVMFLTKYYAWVNKNLINIYGYMLQTIYASTAVGTKLEACGYK